MEQTFINAKHVQGKPVELGENYATIDKPEGLNVQLYPHQAVIVRAMLDLENARVIEVDNQYGNITRDPVKFETSALVLSEPFGSGKTIEILALILHQPIPKAYPTHHNIIKNFSGGKIFHTEIIRRFTRPDALIRPNLIVVGSSVLTQWENTIKTFTNLRALVVGNYYQLKKFHQLYTENKIKCFDVVLLKNGTVTGSFQLPGETETRQIQSLIGVVAKMTKYRCWSRVIYDDFDTISIPSGSQLINSLFSIFVSATKKTMPLPAGKDVRYENILDALRDRTIRLDNILSDKILFTNFNLSNNPSFVEQSTNVPIVNIYRYVYKNPDENYLQLMWAMGDEEAVQVMEMLNGDAINTAAEALGIKSVSVADIFSRMLDKKYEKYIKASTVLDNIINIRKAMPEDVGAHSSEELRAIKASLKTKGKIAIKHRSDELDALLRETEATYIKIKEQSGLSINRAIDNIKEGSCQICCLPLEDSNAFILRCCGLIVCDVCGIKGNQIGNRYDPKTKAHMFVGSCANCKAAVNAQTDLIFVDKTFDMEAIIRAKEIEEPEKDFIEATIVDNKPVVQNPKLRALLDIINGNVPEARQKIDIKIEHMLEGLVDKPQRGEKPKVLVFANYNETLAMIEKFLIENNVEFLRLGGSFGARAATVKKFETSASVLLINSQQSCAGINIQFATDLCYFHKIIDSNIESQVAGRAQRIGRTCNLNIHYLIYNNEKVL